MRYPLRTPNDVVTSLKFQLPQFLRSISASDIEYAQTAPLKNKIRSLANSKKDGKACCASSDRLDFAVRGEGDGGRGRIPSKSRAITITPPLLNLKWFALFRQSHYALKASVSVGAQVVLVGASLLVAAGLGGIFPAHFVLATASTGRFRPR